MTPDIWTIKLAMLSSKTGYEKELFTPIQSKGSARNLARRKE
jgi:hypothetical protein